MEMKCLVILLCFFLCANSQGYPDLRTQQDMLCDFIQYIYPGKNSTECKGFTEWTTDDYKYGVEGGYRYCVSNDFGSEMGIHIPNTNSAWNISLLWSNLTFISDLYTDRLAVGSMDNSVISTFSNLRRLVFVGGGSINTNSITGCLDFTNLSKLEQLNLQENKDLKCPFPNIGHLTKLNNLDYSSTQIYGTIPSQIFLLDKLEYFEFDNCDLSGTIPNVGNLLPNLQVFYLQGNDLTGTIPDFKNHTFLRRINLSGNKLVGTIPYVTYTSKLQEFNVSNNGLFGIIPAPLSDCIPKITGIGQNVFDISGNKNISGNIFCNVSGQNYKLDGVLICNCPQDFIPICSLAPPPNCAVPCDNFTTMGCIGDKKYIYSDTITEQLPPGEYIIIGDLNLNSSIIISNSTIIINNDLILHPGSILELQDSTIVIEGNLILGENSTTIIGVNPITVTQCAYLNGELQAKVPAEFANVTSGTFILIISNCTSGDFNSSVITPNPDSSASGCFHTQLVKSPLSLDVKFDYSCNESESEPFPLELVIGLCVGIFGLCIIVAVIFNVVTPLRHIVRPYSKTRKDEDVEDY